MRAHPRPCGEHAAAVSSATVYRGSSPPVRGAPVSGIAKTGAMGLIPARAGSTLVFLTGAAGIRAHPRPCGEHAKNLIAGIAGLGSSPPVRGAQRLAPGNSGVHGLIPARAGSTGSPVAPQGVTWAHPRPCGEHVVAFVVVFPTPGSSPPVRGARYQVSQRIQAVGLIPARAGSTRYISFHSRRGRAHPRPCGEHWLVENVGLWAPGSSPPVRGAH